MLLVMDIGASKTVLRSLSGGAIKSEMRIDYDRSIPADMILVKIGVALEDQSCLLGGFDRIVISSAPTLNNDGCVTSWPNRPDWVGKSLITLLLPFVTEAILWCDDGVAGALADVAIEPDENLLHLVIGSGVGGSIWNDNMMMFNPEFGHTEIVPHGKSCVCGKLGCLQAYIGSRALDTSIRNNAAHNYSTWVTEGANVLVTFLKTISSQHWIDRVSLSGGFLKYDPDFYGKCHELFRADSDTIHMPRFELSPWAEQAPLKGAEFLAKLPSLEDIEKYAARMVRL